MYLVYIDILSIFAVETNNQHTAVCNALSFVSLEF